MTTLKLNRYTIRSAQIKKEDWETVTIPATPPCPHSNGWYNSIPARFWGRRRVFVCTDCGDILEPIDKKEGV